MKLQSVAAILKALNEAEVRALVVGGLAVNAHGYLRFTKDADLAIQLDPANIERAFRALATLGYQPRVPISAAQFSIPAMRESWIRDKGMKVLQFASDAHRETQLTCLSSSHLISIRNMSAPFPSRFNYLGKSRSSRVT